MLFFPVNLPDCFSVVYFTQFSFPPNFWFHYFFFWGGGEGIMPRPIHLPEADPGFSFLGARKGLLWPHAHCERKTELTFGRGLGPA